MSLDISKLYPAVNRADFAENMWDNALIAGQKITYTDQGYLVENTSSFLLTPEEFQLLLELDGEEKA